MHIYIYMHIYIHTQRTLIMFIQYIVSVDSWSLAVRSSVSRFHWEKKGCRWRFHRSWLVCWLMFMGWLINPYTMDRIVDGYSYWIRSLKKVGSIYPSYWWWWSKCVSWEKRHVDHGGFFGLSNSILGTARGSPSWDGRYGRYHWRRLTGWSQVCNVSTCHEELRLMTSLI